MLLQYIILMLCFYNIITDNDVDKLFLKTALLCCKHKRKGLHITPPCVYVGTWIQAVTKYSSMLGHLYPEYILSEEPSPKPKQVHQRRPGFPSLRWNIFM